MAQGTTHSSLLPVFLAGPHGHGAIYDGRKLRTLREVVYHLEKFGWNGGSSAKLHVAMWHPDAGLPGATISAKAVGENGSEIRIALPMASKLLPKVTAERGDGGTSLPQRCTYGLSMGNQKPAHIGVVVIIHRRGGCGAFPRLLRVGRTAIHRGGQRAGDRGPICPLGPAAPSQRHRAI